MSRGPSILHSTMGRLGGYQATLTPFAVACLGRLGVQAGLGAGHELSLVLCDNATIQRLNRRWRAKDKPTDVLSFPLHTLQAGGRPPQGPLGDIVVSLPTLRAAARAEGLTDEQHLAHLLAHGLLHLLGYDHGTDAEENQMNRIEKRLLAGESL